MQKKLMAVAVASAVGALIAPEAAVAQTSTVQIGGSIPLMYYSHKPNNNSARQRADIMELSEPELFIRGEEKLGGGLSAWFQCTSSLDGLTAGSAPASALCARNSGIGLKGAFGNIFAGNWDTPQKLVFNEGRGAFSGTNALWGGSANLLFGGSSSGVGNALPTADGAATAASNNPHLFYRRHSGLWSYWSPVWNGFQAQAAFSDQKEAVTAITSASPLKPRLYSLAAHYTAGPLYVGIGYEKHNDYNPGQVAIGTTATTYGGGDDDNWTFVARYTFAGVFRLSGTYIRSEFDVTNSTKLKVRGFALYADWRVQGPHTIRAQYAEVDDTKGNTTASVGVFPAATTAGGRGAHLWGVHYEYAFSKRTAGLVSYQKLNNDSAAAYTMGKAAPTLGGGQNSFGIGFKHRF